MQLAHGIDHRLVEPDRPTKSSGSENTFSEDLTDVERIRSEIEAMAADAADWLERHQRYARTVTIKVRYSDFTTITRSHTRETAACDRGDIVGRALDLLARTEAGRRPVRLLGVSVHNLCDSPGELRRRRAEVRLPLFDGLDEE
jgi:DNA polymerase-4